MHRSNIVKSRGMQLIEHRLGRPLRDVLEELYVEEGLTVKQVAVRLDVSAATVSRWMAELGVEARYIGHRKAAV